MHERPPLLLIVLTSLVITAISAVLAVLVHELGHAVAASAVGMRVFSIQLGSGRLVWRQSTAGVRFELRLPKLADPLGLTRIHLLRPKRARLQLAVFLTGGIATNAAMAALAWHALPPLHGGHVRGFGEVAWVMAAVGFGTVNAAMALLSSIPVRVAKTGFRTDGLQLLRLPFISRDEVLESLLGGLLSAIQELGRLGRGAEADALVARVEAEEPTSVAACYLRAARLKHRERFEEAGTVYRQLRTRHAAKPHRAAILAEIAIVDLHLGGVELLEEALQCSGEALELDPVNPVIKVVRGAVLVREGKDPTAPTLLREPLPETLGGATRAYFLRLRAQAEDELGNPEGAIEARALAARLVPEPIQVAAAV